MSTPRAGAVPREATVALPTSLPTVKPSPVNTRVLPLENFTPGPTPTITPIPDEVRGLVVDVIDGNTIAVVMDGDSPGHVYQVRYIGIDVPPRAPDNPWGMVAYEANRNLTRMKVVRLVRDQADQDADGRLLRYVYLGDKMLSVVLAEQGLARAAVAAPNTRYQAEIQAAERQARDGQLGMWGPLPTATPTHTRPAAAGTSRPARTPGARTEATAETATPSTPAPETPTTGPTAAETGTPAATPTPETGTPAGTETPQS